MESITNMDGLVWSARNIQSFCRNSSISPRIACSCDFESMIIFSSHQSLTHAICKENVLDADIPAFVSLVGTRCINFWRLREGFWEHQLALSLQEMNNVSSEKHFYILNHMAVGSGD